MLLGDKVKCLQDAKVLVCGAGGVGGFVIEFLARAGIGTIAILDDDVIKESNLNRQIFAITDTIGKKKTAIAKERVLNINPDCNVETLDLFYSHDTANAVNLENYDFVVDAIDTVSSKIELILNAQSKNVQIISSMGTGNKLKPYFVQQDIYKTTVCPLAKVMRKELKARGVKHLPVVYSLEQPHTACIEENGRHAPASISYVPAAAATVIAQYVISHLIGEEQ